jgi:hypothetical protein
MKRKNPRPGTHASGVTTLPNGGQCSAFGTALAHLYSVVGRVTPSLSTINQARATLRPYNKKGFSSVSAQPCL